MKGQTDPWRHVANTNEYTMIYKKDIDLRNKIEYIICKIVCNDLDIKYTYVGSTKNFTRRKYEHKHESKDNKRTYRL